MYALDTMLELGFADGKPHWKTPDHRAVAAAALLCNRYVNSRAALMEGVHIINGIAPSRIRKVTPVDLAAMGIRMCGAEEPTNGK